ncbi:cytochrome P450 [Xylaria longipes]|nr:cytochrome P450 [Xylaria longipes]
MLGRPFMQSLFSACAARFAPLHCRHGHGYSFFNNSHAPLSTARAYFENTDDLFALTAFGTTFYVITNPRQTVQVYKNTDSLSFEEFVVGLMQYSGLSNETLESLFPGQNPDVLEQVMTNWFDRQLHLTVLQKLCASHSPSTTEHFIEVPLVKWCSELFTHAGEEAYFGDTLQQIEPDMATVFLRYDDLSWQVLYQRGDAWFTKAIENECRALGINRRDMARFMTTVYLVSTNTRKAAFWLMYHLLKNPSSNWASARVVTQDTIIGKHLMRKGNRILIPYRFLYFNGAVFGEHVERFPPGRFEGQVNTLTRRASWRPFGGGKTMCPGHFIAKRETLMFVAMVLQRFDVEIPDQAQAVLEPDLGKPVLGLADCKNGQEVLLYWANYQHKLFFILGQKFFAKPEIVLSVWNAVGGALPWYYTQ